MGDGGQAHGCETGTHPVGYRQGIVGDLIEDYEADHPPLPEASGMDALAFLMEQHELTPGDLPEIGNEGEVVDILAGRRELDIHQLRALASRFGVSAATFV
jgi:HTH-type transcriptional regulator/antitoxin HigA